MQPPTSHYEHSIPIVTHHSICSPGRRGRYSTLFHCPTNLKYGKVAAETSRGGNKQLESVDRLPVDIPGPSLIPPTGSRADRLRVKTAMSRFLVLFLATLLFPMPSSLAAGPDSTYFQQEGPPLTVIRGRAICLDAEGHEVSSLFGCSGTGGRFGFGGKDGQL